MIYETLTLSLRPATIDRLEPVVRQLAAAEWEDDAVQTELINLANDFASRLQRIAKGDVQQL